MSLPPSDDALTIFCWATDCARTAELIASVDRLGEELRQRAPEALIVSGAPIVGVSEEEMMGHFRSLLPGSRTFDRPAPAALAGRRALTFLPPEHELVAEAKSHSPTVHTGLAVPRRFAVVWHPNPLLWWHEALHLLGARDCYDRFGNHRCPEARCVMRAFPMTETGDGRLHLCGKNLRRIAAPPTPDELAERQALALRAQTVAR